MITDDVDSPWVALRMEMDALKRLLFENGPAGTCHFEAVIDQHAGFIKAQRL